MIGQHVARHLAQRAIQDAAPTPQERRRLRDVRARETLAYFSAQQRLRVKKWLARAELRRRGLNKRGEPYVHWSGGAGRKSEALPSWHSLDVGGLRPQDMHIMLRGNCKGSF